MIVELNTRACNYACCVLILIAAFVLRNFECSKVLMCVTVRVVLAGDAVPKQHDRYTDSSAVLWSSSRFVSEPP